MNNIIISNDITLRRLQSDDAIDIYNTINTQREYLGRWLPFVAFTDSEAFTQIYVDSSIEQVDETFTIRKGNQFVGLIGFKATDKDNCNTEIGYWLSDECQGQGIVTRAVRCLCEYAFETLSMNRIQIKCAVGNTSSSNIPKRLAFKFEGVERAGELFPNGNFVDIEVYSILKDEFFHANEKITPT